MNIDIDYPQTIVNESYNGIIIRTIDYVWDVKVDNGTWFRYIESALCGMNINFENDNIKVINDGGY